LDGQNELKDDKDFQEALASMQDTASHMVGNNVVDQASSSGTASHNSTDSVNLKIKPENNESVKTNDDEKPDDEQPKTTITTPAQDDPDIQKTFELLKDGDPKKVLRAFGDDPNNRFLNA
jgi:hypothetical protein